MMKRTFFLTLVLLIAVGTSFAAERPLRVSFAAPATTFLPLWAAKDVGFFKKHKLSVELVHVGSSPIALAALFSNEIDVIAGGGTVGPTAYLQGSRDLALFGRMNNKFVFAVFAHPSIKDVAGLKGKRMGVTRFGGTLDFAARYFLKRAGLDPRKDITLIQIGAVPDLVTALVAGSVESSTVSFPHHLMARRLGFRELADLSQSGARYATTSFLAKKKVLVDRRDEMERFIKALIEATHYVKTNRTEALKMLERHTRISDMDILGPDFDFHAQQIWPRVPEIEPEDLKLILEQLAERNPKAAEINLSELIHGATVEAVVRSGFVEQIYGR